MKFLCYYSWGPDRTQQDEAIRRFKSTGGLPPRGATLLGRWTQADFMGGVALMESDDAKAMTEFALTWSDVMDIKVVPAVDDNELAEVLERMGR